MGYRGLFLVTAALAVVDGLLIAVVGVVFDRPDFVIEGLMMAVVGVAALVVPMPSPETMCRLGIHAGERERYGPFSMKVCRRCGQPYAGYTLSYWTLKRDED